VKSKQGEAVQRKRAAREHRSAEKVREAVATASICGNCFKPLNPGSPIAKSVVSVFDPKMVTGPQRLLNAPPGHVVRVVVPICVDCMLSLDKWDRRRLDEITRCLGCGRPMRPGTRSFIKPRGAKGERERLTCCETCFRKVEVAHDSERRRVKHEPVICTVCEKQFTPTRSDQVICSNRCRQRLHRQRHPYRRERAGEPSAG
jgi:hypothetical protein